MTGFWAGFIVFIFSVVGFSQELRRWENSTQLPEICFQTFNAYGPLYASQVHLRTERMLSELKGRALCDVIQLQEVWMSSQMDQVVNSFSRFSISAPNLKARVGLVTLLSGEVREEQTQFFSENNSGSLLDEVRESLGVRKAFHIVRAKLPQVDEEMYFVNTHLHPTSSEVRLLQIRQIQEWRKNHKDLKMILSGDFNSDISSEERRELMESLQLHDAVEEAMGPAGYPEKFCTYCRENPLSWLSESHTFDYIYYSNEGGAPSALVPRSAQVNLQGQPNAPLSDHYGVRVVFTLKPLVDLNSAE